MLGPVALQTYCSVGEVVWGEHPPPQICTDPESGAFPGKDQCFPVFHLPIAVAAPSLEVLEATFDGA